VRDLDQAALDCRTSVTDQRRAVRHDAEWSDGQEACAQHHLVSHGRCGVPVDAAMNADQIATSHHRVELIAREAVATSHRGSEETVFGSDGFGEFRVHAS
jgi:hypothetical protein